MLSICFVHEDNKVFMHKAISAQNQLEKLQFFDRYNEVREFMIFINILLKIKLFIKLRMLIPRLTFH